MQSLGNNGNYATADGPFGRRYGARFAEISDGLSTTILFGEKHVMLSAFKVQPGTMDVNDFCVYASRNAFSEA